MFPNSPTQQPVGWSPRTLVAAPVRTPSKCSRCPLGCRGATKKASRRGASTSRWQHAAPPPFEAHRGNMTEEAAAESDTLGDACRTATQRSIIYSPGPWGLNRRWNGTSVLQRMVGWRYNACPADFAIITSAVERNAGYRLQGATVRVSEVFFSVGAREAVSVQFHVISVL